MVAELISVGTELLLGNIVNTNAAFLAKECAKLGLSVYHQCAVGDNAKRLSEAIEQALGRSDIVLLSGGLGPTKDDLTKETAAKAVGRNIVADEHTRQQIEDYFKGREADVKIAENNWKQAEVIEGSLVVDNRNGTAPGEIVELPDGKKLILMPGPPNELKPMFLEDIAPYLAGLQSVCLYSEMVKVCGIGESMAETMVLDLIEGQENPTIAPYAKTAEVHFRVTARAASKEEGEGLAQPVVAELRKRFGDNVYTNREEESLEEVVICLLKQQGRKIATAESITGGLIAATLVNVAGASSVLEESFVTYSNEAKQQRLGVKEETLKSYGAVSEQTAWEMAEGICKATKAEVGIAVTGIAGPDGGSAEKPVGLVYMGCCVDGKTKVQKLLLKGDRQKIRDMVVIRALDFVRRCLLEATE